MGEYTPEAQIALNAELANPPQLDAAVAAQGSVRPIGRYISGGAIGFLAAKAAVFVAPLMLSRSWGLADYGRFEFTLALATLLAVPFGVGLTGAIPYFLLKRADSSYLQAFQLHTVFAALALIAITPFYLTGRIAQPTFLAVVLTGIIVIQNIRSTLYKVWDSPVLASVVESGVYVVLLAIVLGVTAVRAKLTQSTMLLVFALYAAVLVALSNRGFNWKISWRERLQRYTESVKFGFPIIATSGLMIFLVTSGRLLSGKLLSMEAVGTYSFFYRLASSVIVLHSLLTTLFFRKLYQSDDASLDRYFSMVLGVVWLAGFVGVAVARPVLGFFLPLLRHAGRPEMAVYLVLAAHMVFWTGTALTEGILYRQRKATHLSLLLSIVVILLVAGSLALKAFGALDLLNLCRVHMGAMFLAFLAQIWLLRTSGVRLIRLPILGAIFQAVYWIAVFLFF